MVMTSPPSVLSDPHTEGADEISVTTGAAYATKTLERSKACCGDPVSGAERTYHASPAPAPAGGTTVIDVDDTDTHAGSAGHEMTSDTTLGPGSASATVSAAA